MKKILGTNKTSKNQFDSVEFLSANEMFAIRGGAEPIKPSTRPKDIFDMEEN